MRVALVDNGGEGAVFTPALVRALAGMADLTVCRTRSDAARACAQEWDAIVLSGSDENVSSKMRIRDVAKDLMLLLRFPETPCLGVCFGMHLVAAAYGGKVGRMRRTREGLRPVETRKGWLSLPAEGEAVFSHGDEVVELPPGFRCTATSEGVVAGMASADMLRCGVQYHPEASPLPMASLLPRFLVFAASRAARLPPPPPLLPPAARSGELDEGVRVRGR